MLSPRNKIEVCTYTDREIEHVDTLYEICNAEFNSRTDVHSSFKSAKGAASWARYYLLHEVRNIATRDDIYCSYHMAFVVASKIAEVWFNLREVA